MQFPTPTPRVRHFLPLMLQELLQWKAPSFWPPLSGLDTAFCVLTSRPNRTQQFQKNAYHNDKCVISEPMQTQRAPWFISSPAFILRTWYNTFNILAP